MNQKREAEAMGATKIQDRGDVVVEEYGPDMMIEHGRNESRIYLKDGARFVLSLPLVTRRSEGEADDSRMVRARYAGARLLKTYKNETTPRCPECGSAHVTTDPAADYPDWTAPELEPGESFCANCSRVIATARTRR